MIYHVTIESKKSCIMCPLKAEFISDPHRAPAARPEMIARSQKSLAYRLLPRSRMARMIGLVILVAQIIILMTRMIAQIYKKLREVEKMRCGLRPNSRSGV